VTARNESSFATRASAFIHRVLSSLVRGQLSGDGCHYECSDGILFLRSGDTSTLKRAKALMKFKTLLFAK
jgi:hypothetical protein